MKYLSLLVLLFPSLITAQTVRIACGQAQPYTDVSGNVWSADPSNVGSAYATTQAILGTPNQGLLQNERYSRNDTPPLTYSFGVANGNYTLNLYFSENYPPAAGVRKFSVTANGNAILTNFSISDTAGGTFTAITKSFTVLASNGVVNLEFDHVPGNPENPKCDAIELIPAIPTQTVNFSISGNLSWNDSTPIQGRVDVQQFQPSQNLWNGLGTFTPDANGNVSGTIMLSTNFADQPTFQFILFDATGKQQGLIQESLPGATFQNIKSITGFKIVIDKASCATLCILADGSTMGTLGP